MQVNHVQNLKEIRATMIHKIMNINTEKIITKSSKLLATELNSTWVWVDFVNIRKYSWLSYII